METVIKPKFILLYNGRDISVDVSKYLLSVSYKDSDQEEADEIDVVLEDVDGLWRNSWYPEKGASLDLKIGFDQDNFLLDCGVFEIDEINLNGPPDTITIKGLATPITKALRTKNSKSFENLTLRQIAKYIGDKHGLTLVGNISNIKFERQTQHKERDLSFLRRISIEYGYIFSVRGGKLIFVNAQEIEGNSAVLEVDKTNLKTYSIKDKTSETYKAATVKYHDPGKNQVNQATVETLKNKDDVTYKQIHTADTLEIRTKAESPAQAEQKATAALHKRNSEQLEGTLTTIGNGLLVCGNSFLLTGLGQASGKMYIKKSTHQIDRGSGYTTSVDFKRISATTDEKKTAKAVVKKANYEVLTLKNKDEVNYNQIVVK